MSKYEFGGFGDAPPYNYLLATADSASAVFDECKKYNWF